MSKRYQERMSHLDREGLLPTRRPRAARLRRALSGVPVRLCHRSGYVAVMIALALSTILGIAALSVDIGRTVMAGQRAQDVADAGAMAGAPLLPYSAEAIGAAGQCVTANNQPHQGFPIVCNYSTTNSTTSDIRYYPPYSYVPGYGWMGYYAKAIQVTTHITVPYTFARVLGLTQKQITRRATAVRAPVGGCPIAPIWVSHPTLYNYGEYQNLLMADGPHYAEIPGSFGWLALPPECTASWLEVLSGLPLSDADNEALFRDVDDLVYAYPGLSVGQWVAGLGDRLARAAYPPWVGETWDNHSDNNPRIIIIPLVSYVGGTGSGATFRIEKFGAFWIDSVTADGNPKHIDGRFIRYTLPGAGIDPVSGDTGLFSYDFVG